MINVPSPSLGCFFEAERCKRNHLIMKFFNYFAVWGNPDTQINRPMRYWPLASVLRLLMENGIPSDLAANLRQFTAVNDMLSF